MTALSMKGNLKPPALPSLHLASDEVANVNVVRLALVAHADAILRIHPKGQITSHAEALGVVIITRNSRTGWPKPPSDYDRHPQRHPRAPIHHAKSTASPGEKHSSSRARHKFYGLIVLYQHLGLKAFTAWKQSMTNDLLLLCVCVCVCMYISMYMCIHIHIYI